MRIAYRRRRGVLQRSAGGDTGMRHLSALLLVAHVRLGEALMFQSHAVTSQWDTWAFCENGTYYAYYLITEHSPGEGFGVATSDDGQHWHDHGYVWHGPSWTQHKWWEGTGSVYAASQPARDQACRVPWFPSLTPSTCADGVRQTSTKLGAMSSTIRSAQARAHLAAAVRISRSQKATI
eukprot:COSAG02_NODE_1764_length_11026_cov_4.823465_2_plen_179_part_00